MHSCLDALPHSYAPIRSLSAGVAALALSRFTAPRVWADGRVEVVLATESGFPATETQRWLKLFTDLKVGGLRIRARQADDEVQVVTEGTARSPVYRVT